MEEEKVQLPITVRAVLFADSSKAVVSVEGTKTVVRKRYEEG